MEINHYHIAYVAWNLFLALLPCWAVYFLMEYKQLRKNKVYFWLIFLFWFFMLPNTAYLFFMVRHLVDYCGDLDRFRVCQMGSWPVMFFFTYGLIGLPTFYYALKKMTGIMAKRFGKRVEKFFPLVMIPFTSIGLMFGLYERFNSWDVLTRPWMLFQALGRYLSQSYLTDDLLFFTLALYLIYYLTDYFWEWRR